MRAPNRLAIASVFGKPKSRAEVGPRGLPASSAELRARDMDLNAFRHKFERPACLVVSSDILRR